MADEAAPAEAVLDAWRAKVRWTTAAAVAAGVGVVGAPVALLAPFVGIAGVLATATALAVPIGAWVAHSAVPSADGKGPDASAKDPLSALVMKEAMTRASPGLRAWADGCLVLTKAGPGAAAVVGLAAAALGAASLFPLVSVIGGIAPALGFLARALSIELPLLPYERPPAREQAEVAGTKAAESDTKRPDGLAILAALRGSPIYRGQDALDLSLPGMPVSTGNGLDLLLARYPRLTRAMVAELGIERLTSSQTRALERILALERVATHESSTDVVNDMVLVGWPGSGRTTLCNLLSFASVAHGEGTVYCIAPESPRRNADGSANRASAGTRHASGQLRRWMERNKWADRLQEAYEDESDTLSLVSGPDVVFTDVRRLGEDILGKAAGEARGLLQRLRYVVIDHPDRLAREELIRLRVSIARLRMTARLYGRGEVRFLVMLPRLGNFQEFGKWLLNNEQLHFQFFDAWYGPARILGWVPPQEFVPQTATPIFARADFTDELVAVLTELGVQAQQLRTDGLDPMRICVVDARPILGPEFRAQLAELVLARLKENIAHTDTLAFVEDWSWYGTADLRADGDARFDVVVTVGIGPHPEHLVASLRSVVADDGLICLVADPSPVDHESVRRMREPGWDPLDAVKRASYPSVLVPQHAEALVAYQMAGLFQDFRERKIPERVIEEVFPTALARSILDRWRQEALLARVEVFEDAPGEDAFERELYVYQLQPNGIRPDRYEVPWGCSNVRVWEIYDETARSRSRAGRSQSTFVDEDRIFIDLSPMAMLRYPPSTVEVVDIAVNESPPGEESGERYAVQGRVSVRQVDFRSGIAVDKRAPRFAVSLLQERAFGRPAKGTPVQRDTLCDVLEGPWAERVAIARALVRPGTAVGGRRPALRLAAGTWILRLSESVRDVAITTGRLVEDHALVRIVPLSAQTRANAARTFDAVGTVLFFEMTESTPADLDVSRPAYAALAGTLRNVLSARFMDFDREYRVVVLPATVNGRWRSWGDLPMPGVTASRTTGFAEAADIVARVCGRDAGSDPRDATVDDLVRVWKWARATLTRDAEGPATALEALQTGRGTARACADALAVCLRVLGLTAVHVRVDDRSFVEVAVPEARLPAVLRALREGPCAGSDVDTHRVEGGAWIAFDLAASEPCALESSLREAWTEEGWSDDAEVTRPVSGYTPWRVVVHRLRGGETHPYDQVGALVARELGSEVLHACMDALEACDCADGCSSCCGGLGVAPAVDAKAEGWDDEGYGPADLVSRGGALGLLSALLGRKPTRRSTTTTTTTPTESTTDNLNALVTQVLGTRVGNYEDGLWTKLFAGFMPLQAEWLSKASWMDPTPTAAGLYRHADNSVLVGRGYSLDFTLEVIVHEYVHNWQFRSGAFDVQRLTRSDDATQFMAKDGRSNLIIEGHATWAEHIFRFHRGLGASYTPTDERRWDAYKTGFFLVEGIVGAFGAAGLYRWMSGKDGPPLRSRDRRLSWPFTIGEAVRAFGLEHEARYGQTDGIDVDLTERTTLEEEPPPATGAAAGEAGATPAGPDGGPTAAAEGGASTAEGGASAGSVVAPETPTA